MNEREFLQALSELPPTFAPVSWKGQGVLRYVRGEGTWCPLTAVAAMRGAYDNQPFMLRYGSCGITEPTQFLQIDSATRDRIVSAADGLKPAGLRPWVKQFVLTWKMRRIYNRQCRGVL